MYVEYSNAPGSSVNTDKILEQIKKKQIVCASALLNNVEMIISNIIKFFFDR